MNTKTLLLIGLALIVGYLIGAAGCFKQTTSPDNSDAENASTFQNKELTVAFYNVENLFDTKDDPNTDDNEFLPTAAKKWDDEKYNKKLNDLYKVLAAIDAGEGVPTIIGVSEVENEQVLQDLISQTPIDDNYEIAHFDSPDARGIDVGLLYDKAIFTLISKENLPVNFDFEPETTTRDVLYVKGEINKQEVHIFVNHWSSRRGGTEASEPKRLACAKVARKKIDAILSSDNAAKIITMGDFNDEPSNNSLLEGLLSKPSVNDLKNKELVNLFYALQEQGSGTYNYRGDWNMLDHISISGGLLDNPKGLHTTIENAGIFREDWMMYQSNNYGAVPNRTYGGPNYYGGYSDHLPIYLKMSY